MSDEQEMTVSGLSVVLTQFLDEIDELVDLEQNSDKAPCSEWIVHVDPITSQSFYRHIQSGETKWDMPKEYEAYLQQFDAYLQLHSQENNLELESRKANKRAHASKRKKKRLRRMVNTVESKTTNSNGSSSHMLTAYSDSSSSEKDSNHETERHTGNQFDQVEEEVDKSDSSDSVIVPLVSYGPSDDIIIPEPKDFIRTHLSSLVRTTSYIEDSTATDRLSVKTKTKNEPEKEVRPIKTAMKRLLKKFSTCNHQFSNIHPVRLLYIQLITRFDDWQAGKLPTDYFLQKLFETERSISELEDDKSPSPSGQKYSRNR